MLTLRLSCSHWSCSPWHQCLTYLIAPRSARRTASVFNAAIRLRANAASSTSYAGAAEKQGFNGKAWGEYMEDRALGNTANDLFVPQK